MNRPKGLSIFITMADTYYSVFQPMGLTVRYKGVKRCASASGIGQNDVKECVKSVAWMGAVDKKYFVK